MHQNNPYIIGRPITELEKFFGRESLFHFLEDNLKQGVKVILLHGQRRIGKSSVLFQIPNFVTEERFNFVPFDLQDKSQLPLSELLHQLAEEIIYFLQLAPDTVRVPTIAELDTDISTFSYKFLPAVYQELGSNNLVLLLDEFDVLHNNKPEATTHPLFQYLNSLISAQKKLFIISVIGRQLDDLPKLLELFKGAPNYEIGLLDEVSTIRLIKNPAEGVLNYNEDAIKAIIQLSAGHPYFTQVICSAVFGQAREQDKWQITGADVEEIVEKAIEFAEGGLAWFWDGLPTPEQVIFSAVAQAQRIAIDEHERIQEPLKLLKEYGVIQTKQLEDASERLVTNGFLNDAGLKVKVELVRRWLIKRYPLRQEVLALESLDSVANQQYALAVAVSQRGKKIDELKYYQDALEYNPNHFSALFKLAEEYLNSENFGKAVEVYTRAYQVAPRRHQQGLVRALLSYGNELWSKQKQKNWRLAKKQFIKVKEIETENQIAREKLLEIEAFESRTYRTNESKRQGILLVAAMLGIPLLVFWGYYLGANICPEGQKKIDGICQVPLQERLSRGERTLFPSTTNNPERNLAIETFQEGDYSKAIELFDRALVAANYNDPELLIYQNNARARQQGNPFTLAAVVPADEQQDYAAEMLRGVAQAQNQFNQNGGKNGRLLEIVIANDNDEPKKARQVAQELIKDQSILGVIGHNSSNASNAGLEKYESAKLAMISPISTSTSLTGNSFFRTVPSDEAAGRSLANYATKKLGIEKIVIFYNPESSYSNSLKDAFEDEFTQLDGKVVRRIDLSNPNLNLKEVVYSSKFEQEYGAKAALLVPSTTDVSAALKIARTNANGPGLKLLGGDTLYSNETLQEGKEAVEGLILSVPWFREASPSKAFADAAKKQWRGDVSWRTATSFDATQMFINTLSDNPSRSSVLARLKNVELEPNETSGSQLKFTSEGERESEPILVEVVNNNFELVKEPEKAKETEQSEK